MKITKYILISISILILICQSVYPFSADVTSLNDANYFKTLHSLFLKAQKSIYIIMYRAIWYDKYPDSFSNKLIDSLIKARKRGVDVRVILDRPFEDKRDDGKENEKVGSMLSNNDIKVYFDSKEITTHSKLIIIDERFVIVGSTNWSYSAISKNNETNALIDSKEVAKEYIKYFEELAALCK